MSEQLERRIEALERAVTDGDHDLSALAADGETATRLEEAEARLDEVEDRLSELDAATQALRGYVGNVRSVNRDIEKRADAALAKAEALESTQDQSPAETDGDRPRAPTADGTRTQRGETSATTGGPDSRPATDGTGEHRSGREEQTGSETAGTTVSADGTARAGKQGETGSRAGRGGDRREAETGSHDHCRACGRPRERAPPDGTDGHGPGRRAGDGNRHRSEGDTDGGYGSRQPGRQRAPSASGADTGEVNGAGETAEAGIASLDPEFRAENEDSDASTLERIRKML